jgi:hypothetical protein
MVLPVLDYYITGLDFKSVIPRGVAITAAGAVLGGLYGLFFGAVATFLGYEEW